MDKFRKVLEGKEGNYMAPFLWLHGEDEKTLRTYMQVIAESNIRAVCIESRPHPDFCGEGWWHDMDIILDEAKKRNMKVWILDDAHFPTGFANGAMVKQPDERCRQSVCCRKIEIAGGQNLQMSAEEVLHPDPFVPSQIEMYIGEKEPRKFDDDILLGIYAVKKDNEKEKIVLTQYANKDGLSFEMPDGEWKIYTLHLSRNKGFHRSYINMLDQASCKVLLDSVYEPHYTRYKEEFGKTIAGFFSDEPELGNGHMYEWENQFGMDTDYPWSIELEEELRKRLGENYTEKLILLWEDDASDQEKAYLRYTYMDCLTRLVEKDFSYQIGEWCRERGVQYIGHLIEDNNQDSRTGNSLGHFFRGLSGQDMAGIDNIGSQVLPGGEDLHYNHNALAVRNGEFYHYMLGKLGNSMAVLQPLKKGNALCEIFGNYGWSEGVQLEKYLLDHFLVRGINYFVPHAFSAKEFPDPDCPPHFYAHGHNPQYRHFGYLMKYANRVCELISGGRSEVSVAIVHHTEADWTGKYMYAHEVGHILSDNQVNYDYIPQDVFEEREKYKTQVEGGKLKINNQRYGIIVVPYMQYIRSSFATALLELQENGIEVIFINEFPQGICDEKSDRQERMFANIKAHKCLAKEEVINHIQESGTAELSILPQNDRLRFYHYEYEDGNGIFLFVNEGSTVYEGQVFVDDCRNGIFYDAWDNHVYDAQYDGHCLQIKIDPLKSQIFVLHSDKFKADKAGNDLSEIKMVLEKDWLRSTCRSIEYPHFTEEKEISLPDCLAQEKPEFSGFVRYETSFKRVEGKKVMLEIEDAKEGVEVFLNGSSLGIQIAPPFQYDLTKHMSEENKLVIEVATTLEREMAVQTIDRKTGRPVEATSLSGITGKASLISIL